MKIVDTRERFAVVASDKNNRLEILWWLYNEFHAAVAIKIEGVNLSQF